MTVPDYAAGGSAPPPATDWPYLAPEAKRERILAAAITVFADRGLEAPMHEVAATAGAGVASIYRVFPSKHDLWAAIVVRRMNEITEACEQARARPGERWVAFVDFISDRVRHQSREPFTIEARDVVADRPEVAESVARMTVAQGRLLKDTQAEGRLRADATVEDLRLLFLATRAARRSPHANVERMLALMLDALELSPSA